MTSKKGKVSFLDRTDLEKRFPCQAVLVRPSKYYRVHRPSNHSWSHHTQHSLEVCRTGRAFMLLGIRGTRQERSSQPFPMSLHPQGEGCFCSFAEYSLRMCITNLVFSVHSQTPQHCRDVCPTQQVNALKVRAILCSFCSLVA